ncbi:MAG: FAD-dependent oxidoreductase [Bacteroidota bacterium]
MKVSIIGGGVIGLSCAYFLSQAGIEVAVFDQGDLESGCSYGNAGMIVPSHFIPLAAPGMIQQGIKWMFDPESPFYIRPRLNLDLFSWAWQFYRAANEKQVKKAMPVLRDLSLLSKQLYRQLADNPAFDFAFAEHGLLMLYKTAKMEAEEQEVAEKAQQLGIEAHVLDGAAVQQMEPHLSLDVRGGVYYPGDAHLAPEQFLQALKTQLRQANVSLFSLTTVQGIEYHQDKIKAIQTSTGRFAVDQLLIAGGAWSPSLTKLLQIHLPLQAGKGYSITLNNPPQKPNYPAILSEAKVAVTPLPDGLRFGGTMEIGGINHTINPRRVKGILQSIPQYLPDFSIALPPLETVWHGLRPCSPDGLPYIGRISRFSNLLLASGHAMMGLSLAPATGHLITQMLQNKKTDLPLTAFTPDRYS